MNFIDPGGTEKMRWSCEEEPVDETSPVLQKCPSTCLCWLQVVQFTSGKLDYKWAFQVGGGWSGWSLLISGIACSWSYETSECLSMLFVVFGAQQRSYTSWFGVGVSGWGETLCSTCCKNSGFLNVRKERKTLGCLPRLCSHFSWLVQGKSSTMTHHH